MLQCDEISSSTSLPNFTKFIFQRNWGKYPNMTYYNCFFDIKCFAKSTKPLHVRDNPLEVSFLNDFRVLLYLSEFFWQLQQILPAVLNFHIQQALLQISKALGISNHHMDHRRLQSSKISKSSLRMTVFHLSDKFLDDSIMKIDYF